MKDKFQEGLNVAKTYDVNTPKDSLVLYSVTNLPTKANRDNAFAYVAKHNDKMMIEHTPCGAKMVELGFASSDTELSTEDISLVWKEASKRLIESASGNVTAFVEKADSQSVFLTMELPTIMSNPNIQTINHQPKAEFASQFNKSERR